ncbi:FucTB [Drosophila busckii]|uniref:Fucosyltransferase n=1 Tax=Drosophila busckii TaxID=30019 RepID=A0A0M4EQE1_DROBS|nr:FucTB [Drosophila busckii]
MTRLDSQSSISLEVNSELLWWTQDMSWRYDEIRHCGLKICRVTNNRYRFRHSQMVLFYGSNLKLYDFPMPRYDNQLWALLHEESPRNVPFVPHDDFLQHFNFTSTFSRYSSIPLTTQYLPQASDLTRSDIHMGLSSKNVYQHDMSLAPVVFLQTDCNTISGREDYVRELMKHIPVDSYGGCLHNRDLPESMQNDYLNHLYSPTILHFLARYKFMIAIENGVCEDYITEKFWRPLIIGVIPIYFGSTSIRDWQPNNDSAIFIEDFPNAGALAAYLQQLELNETAYNAYLHHKIDLVKGIQNQRLIHELKTRSYQFQEDRTNDENSLFRKFECAMCKRTKLPLQQASKRHYNCSFPPVHVPLKNHKEPKFAADWRSMMGVGRCQAKLLDAFWRTNLNYTKNEFESRLNDMLDKRLCN